MLIFAHVGITLGAALLLNGAISKSGPVAAREGNAEQHLQESPRLARGENGTSGTEASRLASLRNHIDIRLLLVGSLLPDIIDKPVGLCFFRDTFSTGRIFCHTLLFLIAITLAAVYLYRSRGKVWLLVLSFGTLTHIMLDEMWLHPRTLLWPLYGFKFPPEDLADWSLGRFSVLLTEPGLYVPELIGAIILIWFVSMLVRNRKLYAFVKNGRAL